MGQLNQLTAAPPEKPTVQPILAQFGELGFETRTTNIRQYSKFTDQISAVTN